MFLVAYTPLTIGFEWFVGSWLLTTHKDIKKRGTLPLLILYHEALVNPFARISNERPRRIWMPPNRAVHCWTLCGGIYISQRAFTAILFWAIVKFTRFRYTKTSANKRFYNMSAKSIAWFCVAKVQIIFYICKRKMVNLNKQHFLCFGVLWSFLGSSLVFCSTEIGKVQ